MLRKVTPILLCGGENKRLWPAHDKAFLKLNHKQHKTSKTLFEDALLRCINHSNVEQIIIVCNINNLSIVKYYLKQYNIKQEVFLIIEPIAQDTSAAVISAALLLQKNQLEGNLMLVMPSDQLFENNFDKIISQASEESSIHHINLFGSIPSFPSVDYGYITTTHHNNSTDDNKDFINFVEKPTLEKATSLIQQGNSYWNLGLICTTPDVLLEEVEKFCPQTLYLCTKAILKAKLHNEDNLKLLYPEQYFYKQIRKISIDYSVLVNSNNLKLLKTKIHWQDLGTWSSMRQNINHSDVHANHDCEDFIFVSTRKPKTVALGVKNMTVIDMNNTLLLLHNDHAQKLSNLSLPEKSEVMKPWGTYDILINQTNYVVKKMDIYPNSRTSLQAHKHRAEHWIIISGSARVIIANQEAIHTTGQYVFVPKDTKHRIENIGSGILTMIEIQQGCICDENDIERFEDDYNRETIV